MTNRLLALLVAALLLAPALLRAQTYQPETGAAVALAYPWIDISATGTQVGLQDDQVSSNIDIGFTFTYGTVATTRVRIASNGLLMFDTTSTEYRSSPLPFTGAGIEPSIDAVMAVLYDDYQPDGTGTYLRYRRMGTAPNRIFVVSWLAVPYYCWNSGTTCDNDRQTTNASATFQVQIHEQGHFVYRYGNVNGAGGAHSGGATFTNPDGGTVGYEVSNSDYVQYAYEQPVLTNGTTIVWRRGGAAPGGFNAFETSTAAGSITGVLKTKVAGSAFSAAVVALNSTRTAVATTFSGDVKVELVDTSNNTGTLDASTGCRSTWTTVLQTATLAFAAIDAGRDTVTFTENNAWPNLRLRMSWPATGTPSVVACSTDNFAIRPAAFANFAATDADWATAGTTRTLANASATGGQVHRAGRPFTIRATAVNAASATTGNYTGAPTALVSACAGTACTASFGALSVNLTATAGQVSDAGATYAEAGAFTLQLSDSSFASVDTADSSAAERTVLSPAITVGRFVPDRFEVATLAAPVLRTFGSASCTSRSFTYIGQPFGYATRPQATVTARNAAGAATTLYAGALWKLTVSDVVQAYGPAGLDASAAANAPTLGTPANGSAVLSAPAASVFAFTRSSTTPQAPFAAAVTLAWSVSDDSEAGVAGNGTIATATPLVFDPIAFDAGNTFRYGVLKLASAHGSELNHLPVMVEAQVWNGSAFVGHAADQCTAVPAGALAMANWQRQLAACETAPLAAATTLSGGRGVLTLHRPGSGNAGSVDLALQLGAAATGTTCTAVGAAASPATAANLPWLQGKWGSGANYATNPSARASFGTNKSPLIYLRESF